MTDSPYRPLEEIEERYRRGSQRGPTGMLASAADVPHLCRALRTMLEGLETAHEDGARDAHDVICKAISELERERPVDGGYVRPRRRSRA
jgi:hypothetical protein